jgi:hypothetical protein
LLYAIGGYKYLILSTLAIVLQFSTTGYFNMLFVIGYYYTFINKKIRLVHIIVLGVMALLLFPIVYDGIKEKLSSSSGLTRISDVYIGWLILSKNFFTGADPGIADYSKDPEILKIKYQVWDNGIAEGEMGIDEGYVNSGFCSGIMFFFVTYGVPVASYFLYKFFQFPLIREKALRIGVLIVILLTLMTEPQSFTAWFYFFVLAKFIRFQWFKRKVQETNKTIHEKKNRIAHRLYYRRYRG